MELNEQLSKAIHLANKYHEGQVDKSGLPYILHPLHVMNNVDSIEEKIVAVLHDILEDTILATGDLIIYGFDLEIVEAVVTITRIKGEPYANYLERVKSNELARIVKLADLTHNMDITRLHNPTEKDYKRVEKYKKAYKYLKLWGDSMINYNSQVTKGSYKIQFETDDKKSYQKVQDLIRELIDRNEETEEEIITSFFDLVK